MSLKSFSVSWEFLIEWKSLYEDLHQGMNENLCLTREQNRPRVALNFGQNGEGRGEPKQ